MPKSDDPIPKRNIARQATSTVAFTADEPEDDSNAWWHRLEVSRRKHELYARRVLPGAHGRSAAASVAVAVTLAHPNRSVLAGQRATLDAMRHARHPTGQLCVPPMGMPAAASAALPPPPPP